MRRLSVAATTAAGLALLAYALHIVGVARLRAAVAAIGWGFGAILVISGAREVARAAAWTRSLDGSARLSVWEAFRARLAGEALNSLLPLGMVVGEPAKAEHVGRHVPFGAAIKALAVEWTFYGVSIVLLFSAGAVALFPAPAVPGLAAAALVLTMMVRQGRRVPSTTSGGPFARAIGRSRQALSGLTEPVRQIVTHHRGRAVGLVALESAYHALGVLEVYLTVALINPGRVAWASALALELVNRAVTVAFKVLPMRIGVDEAGAAVAAARLDLGAPTGIMVALVRKVRLLFWSAIGLGFLLARLVERSRAPARLRSSSAWM